MGTVVFLFVSRHCNTLGFELLVRQNEACEDNIMTETSERLMTLKERESEWERGLYREEMPSRLYCQRRQLSTTRLQRDSPHLPVCFGAERSVRHVVGGLILMPECESYW